MESWADKNRGDFDRRGNEITPEPIHVDRDDVETWCGETIAGLPESAVVDMSDDATCAACIEAHDENQAERAYERSISDYYGGGGPASVQEQYEAAHAEKRRLS